MKDSVKYLIPSIQNTLVILFKSLQSPSSGKY